MRLFALFMAEAAVFLLASVNQRATAKYRLFPTLVYIAGATFGSYLGMRLTYRWEE